MNTKKRIFQVALLSFFILLIFAFKPVPIPAEANCKVMEGTVSKVFEGGEKDVVFLLHENDVAYYINRGLELGLTLESLRYQLKGKKVTIKYPKYWTPLDPYNKTRHISKLESDGEVIFTEVE